MAISRKLSASLRLYDFSGAAILILARALAVMSRYFSMRSSVTTSILSVMEHASARMLMDVSVTRARVMRL